MLLTLVAIYISRLHVHYLYFITNYLYYQARIRIFARFNGHPQL